MFSLNQSRGKIACVIVGPFPYHSQSFDFIDPTSSLPSTSPSSNHHKPLCQPQPQPPPLRCGRNRCNCFNASSSDEDDFDLNGFTRESVTDSNDSLKSLIPCATVEEWNLLADATKIVEENSKVYKRKEDLIKIVAEALSSLGYDSSICKSKWEKTSSCPSGEYQFIVAIVEGEALIIDIDFRSEFEIARSTGTYKTILQSLPYIFVGERNG